MTRSDIHPFGDDLNTVGRCWRKEMKDEEVNKEAEMTTNYLRGRNGDVREHTFAPVLSLTVKL